MSRGESPTNASPPGRADHAPLRARLRGTYPRLRSPLLVTAGVLIALATVALHGLAQPQPERLTQRDIDAAVERTLASATPAPSWTSLAYETISPSVVQVLANGPRNVRRSHGSLGTGIVIDSRGIILTALHVVQDGTRVEVIFAEGTRTEAAIIGQEPEYDLAVLQAAEIPDDLVPATLASSTGLRVGDDVAAVGHPFGITGSLSAGVVSGLGRTFQASRNSQVLTDLIQFDAAVNPGNSGGPLVNRNGELVGIVTALVNPTEQDVFIGIGFAVPIETAAGAMGSPWY